MCFTAFWSLRIFLLCLLLFCQKKRFGFISFILDEMTQKPGMIYFIFFPCLFCFFLFPSPNLWKVVFVIDALMCHMVAEWLPGSSSSLMVPHNPIFRLLYVRSSSWLYCMFFFFVVFFFCLSIWCLLFSFPPPSSWPINGALPEIVHSAGPVGDLAGKSSQHASSLIPAVPCNHTHKRPVFSLSAQSLQIPHIALIFSQFFYELSWSLSRVFLAFKALDIADNSDDKLLKCCLDFPYVSPS